MEALIEQNDGLLACVGKDDATGRSLPVLLRARDASLAESSGSSEGEAQAEAGLVLNATAKVHAQNRLLAEILQEAYDDAAAPDPSTAGSPRSGLVEAIKAQNALLRRCIEDQATMKRANALISNAGKFFGSSSSSSSSSSSEAHEDEKDAEVKPSKATESSSEATPSQQVATAPPPPASANAEKVLIHREGQFILVDANDVEAQASSLPEMPSEPASAAAAAASSSPKAPPKPNAQRSQSAKSSPAKSLRPISSRPKSAFPSPSHAQQRAISAGPGGATFTSEDGKQAYDAWLRRKKEQQKDELRSAQKDPGIDMDEKRRLAQESFEGWLRRKKETSEQQRQKDKETEMTDTSAARRRAGRAMNEEEFEMWLEQKKEDDKRRRQEERIRTQLEQDFTQHREEKEQQSTDAVRQWLASKKRDEEERRREFKERQRQYAREAKAIKVHLSRPSVRDDAETLERSSLTRSASLRLHAKDKQHSQALSVTIHKI